MMLDMLQQNMDEYLPLRDVVFNTLRQAILTGELKPGERLMEIHLADRLGVSRTPIREAIRKLELEGLVVMIPRKGAQVARITEKNLKDVLEVRRALDMLAVRLACDRMDNETKKELKKACDEFAAVVQNNNTKDITEADVRFHDVVFGYEPGVTILKGINLYAKPGQKIAFVGSTGAGKTTITNLINRFYDIESGSITYDGIDVKLIHKDDLRRSISIVLQDTHLFTGTIADNIRYGNLHADMDDVINAAKLANAHSFIKRLPNGYDTMLSGDGANLSQGQRQLLAIARAAIANPPVLILDEATSSIDTRTEKLIEKGMDRLMENRTVFVIAHRLSTVRNSNAIMVLDHGEIIERGSHDELLEDKGRYYQLYTGQFELD